MKKKLIVSLIYLLIITLNSCTKRKIERNGCESPAFSQMIGDSCEIYVPNIFTPNNDGLNDFFQIMCSCNISDFKFIVKKNQKVVFETTDQYFSSNDALTEGEFQTGVFDYSISGEIDGLIFSNSGEITFLFIDFSSESNYDYIIENCENCNTGNQFSNGFFNPQIPIGDLFCN